MKDVEIINLFMKNVSSGQNDKIRKGKPRLSFTLQEELNALEYKPMEGQVKIVFIKVVEV